MSASLSSITLFEKSLMHNGAILKGALQERDTTLAQCSDVVQELKCENFVSLSCERFCYFVASGVADIFFWSEFE